MSKDGFASAKNLHDPALPYLSLADFVGGRGGRTSVEDVDQPGPPVGALRVVVQAQVEAAGAAPPQPRAAPVQGLAEITGEPGKAQKLGEEC